MQEKGVDFFQKTNAFFQKVNAILQKVGTVCKILDDTYRKAGLYISAREAIRLFRTLCQQRYHCLLLCNYATIRLYDYTFMRLPISSLGIEKGLTPVTPQMVCG
jgi:hypothetical protein